MNRINNAYKWVIKKEGFDQAKKLGYQVLSRQLSPQTVEETLKFFDKVDSKLASHQKKVKNGTMVVWGLEKGSSALGKVGKVASTVNNYYKVSGLDTVETAARLAEYSKSRDLANKGQTVDELLTNLRTRIIKAKKLFQHINEIQEQGKRKEEFADLNCPMNAIEVINQEDWEGEYELIDLELETEREQEKRNSRISSDWETVKKENRQPQLTTNAWINKQSKLKSALNEALNEEMDYKSQIEKASEEEWIEWGKIAKQEAINRKSSSVILKYAKKGQGVFQMVDGKVQEFAFEADTIKTLVEEIKKQLEYSLYQKGLSKVRLDNEKLANELDKVVKWTERINQGVSQVHSYVKVGGNIANKVVNNLERKSEYKALVNNPYGYNDREDELMFEEELEQVEKPKAEVVEEKPKSWTNWLLGK